MSIDLDEIIFSFVAKYLRKSQKKALESNKNTVFLKDITSRLTLIANAVSGKSITIYPAEKEGGYKNNNFFLPEYFNQFESYEKNIAFYFFRILYLSTQQSLELNWNEPENDVEKSQNEAKIASTQILPILFENFPKTRYIYAFLLDHFLTKKATNPHLYWLYGKFMFAKKEENIEEENTNHTSLKSTKNNEVKTTLKTVGVEEIKSLQINKKQQEDDVLNHSFEKVETVDEFYGNWKNFDGEDELEEHNDALEEIKMRFTVRVDDTVHSIYQSDFIENLTVAESAEKDAKGTYIYYNEWDFSALKYRTNFCKVYPKLQLKTDPKFYYDTIKNYTPVLNKLRKSLTHINNKLLQQKKQTQGNEFDIDALTDLYVDIHTKKTPSENIYFSNRKKEKDLSILLLLDVSLSSDSYVDGNKVLDVEKEVSILFGEILHEFNIDFSIDSFSSKTRNHINYITLKDFTETWDIGKKRIGYIKPGGYTRIGGAIRHAGNRLKTRKTKNRWIILISDGKPNDYDKYEGKYGINDVKQALKELYRNQINSYALTIEAQAKYYLPQMFGQNHFQILKNPIELINALVYLFDKIKKQ
ncbi:NorD protein [Flavobacterium columnare ATCC 49512]|uniref:NorD protein n=1 Tax=Flavobacterium columnare (strain ATCC 49512 / CIP 103533 / TG 44/87) TaxID=1041826 RepID=G8X9Z1_FLACA|nr:VWA domain-containing protein [Flavobacterium columnare]AEW85155.1 NorD protein [Flavobacterium columnare ATCC 49512]